MVAPVNHGSIHVALFFPTWCDDIWWHIGFMAIFIGVKWRCIPSDRPIWLGFVWGESALGSCHRTWGASVCDFREEEKTCHVVFVQLHKLSRFICGLADGQRQQHSRLVTSYLELSCRIEKLWMPNRNPSHCHIVSQKRAKAWLTFLMHAL